MAFPRKISTLRSPGRTLLLCLLLHLLHLHSIWITPLDEELVVPHAEEEDALVNSQSLRVKDKVLLGRKRGSYMLLKEKRTCF